MKRCLHNRSLHRIFAYLWMGIMLAISGCANTTSIPLQLARYQSALDYYAWLIQASGDAISTEKSRLESNPELIMTREDKVRLALILGYGNEPKAREQAQVLLRSFTDNPSLLPPLPDDYQILGLLWTDYLALMNDLDSDRANTKALQQQIEHQHSDYQALLMQVLQQDELLATIEQNNRLLQRQNSLLQQQLEALTDIEEQLMDRGRQDNDEAQ